MLCIVDYTPSQDGPGLGSFYIYAQYLGDSSHNDLIGSTNLKVYLLPLQNRGQYNTGSTVPEFPLAMPILVIGIASLVVFYRMKSS